MPKCPKCNAQITQAQLKAKSCPKCASKNSTESDTLAPLSSPDVGPDKTIQDISDLHLEASGKEKASRDISEHPAESAGKEKTNEDASFRSKQTTNLNEDDPSSKSYSGTIGHDTTVEIDEENEAEADESSTPSAAAGGRGSTHATVGVDEVSSESDSGRARSPSVPSSKSRKTSGTDSTHVVDDESSSAAGSIFATVKTAEGGNMDTAEIVVRQRNLRLQKAAAGESSDYEVLSKLGEGGMGVVYRANQRSINREVAIKLIKGDGLKAQNRRKFLAEAAVTGALAHPNIVPIHDLGYSSDGSLFYSMKIVDGQDWENLIKEKRLDENIEILLRVADAIAFAHDKDIVHRDIKPENVMLGDYGEVVVMDWGMAAKLVPGQRLSAGGTPAYMSPEMAQDYLYQIDLLSTEPSIPVGKPSDIYLLGAVLFEIVSGQPPHASSGEGSPRQQAISCVKTAANNTFTDTEAKDHPLMAIALRAMAELPQNRYASVSDFQDAIREYQLRSQSIQLADRASQDLAEAKQTKEYDALARAQFGFRDAIELWPENEVADKGLRDAKIAFVETAYEKEDFDLGISLLSKDNDDDLEWRAKLEKGKRARDGRKWRLIISAWSIAVLLVAIAGISISFLYRQKRLTETAVANAEEAKRQEIEAKKQKGEADKQRERAVRNEKNAIIAANEAIAAKDLASRREEEAKEARNSAIRGERAASYGRFVSRIALADARLSDNDPGRAGQILERIRQQKTSDDSQPNQDAPPLYDWEWKHLYYLCHPELEPIDTGASIARLPGQPAGKRVAVSSTGKLLATLTSNSRTAQLSVWQWTGDDTPAPENDFVEEIPLKINEKPMAMQFAGKDRFLVVGLKRAENNLVVFDTQTKAITDQRTVHSGQVNYLDVFEDRIATVGNVSGRQDSAEIRLWNISQQGKLTELLTYRQATSGKPLRKSYHDGNVLLVRFANDGSYVLEANSKTLLLRGLNSEGKTTKIDPVDLKQRVQCVATSPVDRQTFAYAIDNQLFIARFKNETIRFPFGEDNVENDFRKNATFSMAEAVESLQQPRVVHRFQINDIEFSRDGKFVLTASNDRTVGVWNTATGKIVKLLRGHEDNVISVDTLRTSKGSHVFTSIDVTGRLRIWDPSTYLDDVHIDEIKMDNRLISSQQLNIARISTDGKTVVTGSRLGVTAVYDEHGKLVANTLIGHRPSHRSNLSVFIKDDDCNLVSSSLRGSTYQWEPKDGMARPIDLGRILRDQGHAVLSADGNLVARRANSTTIRVFSKDQKIRDVAVKLLAESYALSNDGTIVISGEFNRLTAVLADGSEQIWNARSSRGAEFASLAIRESDGSVVGVSEKGGIRLWDNWQKWSDRELQPKEHALSVDVKSAQLENGLLLLQTKSPQRPLVLWDTLGWQEIEPPNHIDSLKLRDACLSRDAKHVFLLDENRGLLDWNLSEQQIKKHPLNEKLPSRGNFLLAGATEDKLVTYTTTSGARIWNLETNEEQGRCISSSPVEQAVAFSLRDREAHQVATVSRDNVLRVWETTPSTEMKLVHSFLLGPETEITSLSLSADETQLEFGHVSPKDGSHITLIDLKTNQSRSIDIPGKLVSIASRKEHIAIATNDRVFLWNRRDDRPSKLNLSDFDQGETLSQIAFSPDETVLGLITENAGDSTQSIKIHNLQLQSTSTIPNAEDRRLTAIEFSPSGRRLFVGDDRGSIGVWHFDKRITDQAEPELIALRGHDRPTKSVDVSTTGMLVSCDADRIVLRYIRTPPADEEKVTSANRK